MRRRGLKFERFDIDRNFLGFSDSICNFSKFFLLKIKDRQKFSKSPSKHCSLKRSKVVKIRRKLEDCLKL